jgi:hypothetical protein
LSPHATARHLASATARHDTETRSARLGKWAAFTFGIRGDFTTKSRRHCIGQVRQLLVQASHALPVS